MPGLRDLERPNRDKRDHKDAGSLVTGKFGEPGWIRTIDPLLKRQMLYH